MNATGVVAVARAAGATAGAERAPGEPPYLVYYRGSLEAVEIRGLGFEGEVSELGAWGRLRGRAGPPRLDHLGLGPILHLPGMFEHVPGDPPGCVARGPAAGNSG